MVSRKHSMPHSARRRRETREDFHRFPPFEGEVTHEAMTAKVVF
jgi:hypothetical protein